MKSAPFWLCTGLLALMTSQASTQTEITPIATPSAEYAGTYNVATGVFTPGETPQEGGGVVYDNTLGSGFFFQPGPGVISMDFGTLAAGGANFITDIQIGYATTSANPVDMIVRLHEGGAGFGIAGDCARSFLISGLPGSDGVNVAAFVVDLDLADSELTNEIADGPIGYSYEFFETETGPLLIGPPNEAGVVDAFDQYTTDNCGGYIGTFFFGGVPFASFHMQLTGSTVAPSNAICKLLVGAFDQSLQFPGDPDDVLLVNFLMMFDVTQETMPTFPIPNEPILDGLDVYFQVIMKNQPLFPQDPIQLSNGIRATLGSFDMPETFGADTTIDLWANMPTPLGGFIDMDFQIEGF